VQAALQRLAAAREGIFPAAAPRGNAAGRGNRSYHETLSLLRVPPRALLRLRPPATGAPAPAGPPMNPPLPSPRRRAAAPDDCSQAREAKQPEAALKAPPGANGRQAPGMPRGKPGQEERGQALEALTQPEAAPRVASCGSSMERLAMARGAALAGRDAAGDQDPRRGSDVCPGAGLGKAETKRRWRRPRFAHGRNASYGRQLLGQARTFWTGAGAPGEVPPNSLDAPIA